ncbi:MAG: hypothetical protein WAZ31_00065 [Rectinemataceae bacterium]
MQQERASKKIVLIGAGSKEFSGGLINDLALEAKLARSVALELWMVDIDPDALAVMAGYAKKAFSLMGADIAVHATIDRTEALPGADFVLLAVEQRRMELWEQDFRLPLAFGMEHIYGENGGPGALFHTLRNYEIVFPIVADIEKFCPSALLINFTNPEARILKGILTLTRVKAVGLCHGFYSFHSLVGKMLGRDTAELDIRTAGMNHFYTYYRISDRKTGENLAAKFEEALERNPDALEPFVRHFWKTFGTIGYNSDHHVGEYVPYSKEFTGLRWLFGLEGQKVQPGLPYADANVRFQAWRYKKSVAEYLRAKPDRHLEAVLADRETLVPSDITGSGELAVPLMAAMSLGETRFLNSVNILNTGGYIPNLDRNACIEIPACVQNGEIIPDSAPPLPEGFAAQVRLQHSIQALIVEAYRTRSRKLLLQALLLDPVVTSASKAQDFLDAGFELQSSYLKGWL